MKFFRRYRLRKQGLSSSASRLTEEHRRIQVLLNSSIVVKTAIALSVFILILMNMMFFGRYYNLGVTTGFKADMDYYNSFEFKYEDKEKTQEKRMEAVSKIPDIYRIEDNELDRDLSKLLSIVMKWLAERTSIETLIPQSQADIEALRNKYNEQIKSSITIFAKEDASLITGLAKPLEGITKLSSIPKSFLKDRIVLSNAKIPQLDINVSIKQFLSIEQEIAKALSNEFKDVSQEDYQRLSTISSLFINQQNINHIYIRDDPATKELLQNAAKQNVKTEYRTVTRGDTIISRDRLIQRQHIVQMLENQLRSEAAKTNGEKALYYLGIAAIVAIVMLIFGSYLRFYQPHIFFRNSRLSAAGVAIVLTILFSKAFIYFRVIHPFFDYPIFISFAAVLASLLLGITFASVLSLLLTILIGVMFDFSLPHGIITLVTGIAGAHFAGNVRRRSELLKVSLITAGVNSIIIFAVSMAWNSGTSVSQLWECFGGFIFCMTGAGLATISLPVFEYVFKITTNISLMELTDTKNQVLKRLIMEAPGTYHHSLVVGNLAEAAAEKINANPLLARVASYYHDIGKLKKPEYFSENEKLSKSKHDTLFPNMSSLIIVSHVKEGVDLAIKHKLPREIIDIIKQHHGTNLVYYFYKRAMEMGNESGSIDDRDFRYPGPRPRSKEAAIIMLADSVEAASRSLDPITASKLSSLVHDILTSKFDDGQLDECDLTLKDIHSIGETFTHILMGSLHQRVKYPKDGERIVPANGDLPEPENDRIEKQSGSIKH